MMYDLPWVTAETNRDTNRYVLGGTGDFDLFARNWKWDVYANLGRTYGHSYTHNARNNANYNLALDAVRDPATGSIVCRSTLTNPNNGCVPFDAMGTGVNSQAAVDYVTGTANDYQSVSEDDYGASVTGELFRAGPVRFPSRCPPNIARNPRTITRTPSPSCPAGVRATTSI